MMRKCFFFVVFLAVSFAGICGCGYTTRSSISDKYKSIYIAPFSNSINLTNEMDTENKYRIYRPQLETDVTKSITNKFLFDGNLRPVSETTADLILRGELVDFRRDPVRYDDNDNVIEYRISVRVNMRLYDRKAANEVWKEDGFSGEKSYFVPGQIGSMSDAQAVNEAVADLARRVVERTVEQW